MFIPVQIQGAWWCYAIDLKEHKVFIIDPTTVGVDKACVGHKHRGTIKVILDSVKGTISTLFDGWDLKFGDFEIDVVKTTTLTGCPR
jgi:hypothetical protein